MGPTNTVPNRITLQPIYFDRNPGAEEQGSLEVLAISEFFNTQRFDNVAVVYRDERSVLAVGLPSYFSALAFTRVISAHTTPSLSSNTIVARNK